MLQEYWFSASAKVKFQFPVQTLTSTINCLENFRLPFLLLKKKLQPEKYPVQYYQGLSLNNFKVIEHQSFSGPSQSSNY